MGNAQLARVLIEELSNRIEDSRKYINSPNQELADYHKKQIEENRHRIWVQQLILEKYEKRKKTLIRFGTIGIFLVLIASFFFFTPGFNLFAVKETPKNYFETPDIVFNNSGTYEFTLKENGTLDFVKLSGLIAGDGDMKIYLDNLLVVDSTNIAKKRTTITGFATEGDSSSTPSDSAPSTNEQPPAPETPSIPTGEQPTTPETTPTEQPSSSEQTGGGTPQNESISQQVTPPVSENITAENITQEAPTRAQEITLREFNSICEETCNLAGLNLTKESYTLRIELTNARLKLTGLEYGLVPFTPLENITLPAENITLEQNLTTNETNVSITTLKVGKIVVGKPVKWKKVVEMNNPANITVELPSSAENVSVNKIEESNNAAPARALITGFALSQESNSGTGLFSWLKNFFARLSGGLTGRVISEEQNNSAQPVEVSLEDNATQYEITYETPAPEALEENTSNGKIVTISAPDELNYSDVTAYIDLPREVPLNAIRLYHIVNGSREQTQFDAYDDDENGLIDYIEWNVPHLSNQTYELIIITKAEHLDENRISLEDVYDYVRSLDGNWTEIPEGHYLRVKFEKNLTNTNDITIYARASQSKARIEVYEIDKNESLGSFEEIKKEGEYKFYLANLTGEQDTFDLKISGNPVEFDYVVDPTLSSVNGTFFDGFESGSFATNNWNISSGNWEISSDDKYAGTYSAHHDKAVSSSISTLENNINTTGYQNISFSFYYRTGNFQAGYYFYADWYNGTNWINVLNATSNTAWTLVNVNLSSAASNNLNFKVRFVSYVGHHLHDNYLDNVNITGIAISGGADNAPTVTLSYPPADYVNSTSQYVNMTFNASVTDDFKLVNCTLWHNATGTWHLNQTQNVSGTSNITSFNLTNLNNVSFIWNIRCRDNASQTSWGSANRTVILNYTVALVSDNAPNVTLVSPANGNITDVNNVTLNCSATDDFKLKNITFYWNYSGSFVANETVNLGGTYNSTTFLRTNLSNGAIKWNCYACDNASNCSFAAANRTVSINYTVPDVTPPASVTNLANMSQGTTWIYWNWTNPTDSDFNSSIIYLNGTNVANTSNNYYNATGLIQNTNYTIRINTKDSAGNVNYTNVTSTAKTSSINQAPTHTTPILSSSAGTNTTSENLTCYNQSTSDADGDSVKNIFTWKLNNGAYEVLNMPFAGGSNSTYTKDYSGLSNNGNVSGAVWNSNGGYDGKGAYTFDGSTSLITVGRSDNLEPNYNLTIAVWFKRNGTQNSYAKIVWYGNNDIAPYGIYGFEFNGTTNIIRLKITNASDAARVYSETINDNIWYFAAGTYDGSTARLYINGVEVGNSALIGPIGTYDGTNGLGIGDKYTKGQKFTGSIDDVRIYNKTLSAQQIQALYNNRTNLIVSQELAAGQNWTCQVTPNDGYQDGSTLNSNSLTIVSTAANNAPQITWISSIPAVNLNEGPASTSVNVNFTAYDGNGASDINISSAMINFTRAGEALRVNYSCANISTIGNYMNFTCNVPMYWYDDAGTWNITAFVKDSTNLATLNSSNFTVNALTGFVASPNALAFGSMAAGSTNMTSINDPIVLNNTGNQNISLGNVQINVTNLRGETNSLLALFANNFSVGVATGGNAECGATTMSASTYVGITGAFLPRGNFSVNDGSTGQEQLYFCIKKTGSELTSQAYSTSNEGAWTIKILIVGFALAGRRKKKKDRKSLVEGLLKIKVDLQKRNELEKVGVLEEAIKDISERAEVPGITEAERMNIPITIFSKEVGALETLCKYMKENLGMSYHEIAIALNRNERTIWTACHKAQEKSKEKIYVGKTEIFIPSSILGDRKYTILEAVIVHLKSRGMRFNEIAKLVDRDQRNVWTIYSRAIKKS